MMFLWIFLVIIAGLVIWYFGNEKDKYLPFGNRNKDALDLLKKRLAKGEIDEKEYYERKAILEEDEN